MRLAEKPATVFKTGRLVTGDSHTLFFLFFLVLTLADLDPSLDNCFAKEDAPG